MNLIPSLIVSIQIFHWFSLLCYHFQIITVTLQSLSHVRLFATPWTAAHQASLSITNSRSPPKPMSIESVMPSNRLILCGPLLLLPSIFPSTRSFQMSQLSSCGQSRSFSFNISPSNEHPGLISFRMDWLDLLAVQGTLKSLLQHHSSKASIHWPNYYMVLNDAEYCRFLSFFPPNNGTIHVNLTHAFM